MVDIHTHILPRVDDGADSSQTSLAMLQREKEEGITSLVLTPHYYGKRSPQRFLAKRQSAFEAIREQIPEGLEVRLGAEVHFTGVNVPDFEELCSLAIEGTQYILLEFPFTSQWTSKLLDSLSDFINDTGYTPVVAHVERYSEILRNPKLATELVDMGCLLQVNAGSFLDRRSKGFAFALLKRGLTHCIGSDAHDLEKRPVEYQKAKKAIENAGLLGAWEKAQENMEIILRGGQVRVEDAKPVKKFLGIYF